MTRCRQAAATGNAMVADRNAIPASMCGSSPVSPITDGIRLASRGRPASEVWSLTWRATAASSGWVHAGWSPKRSPASSEASSMKHAPLRGLRCLPRASIGSDAGGCASWGIMLHPNGRFGPAATQSAPQPAGTPAPAALAALGLGPGR